MIKQNFNTGWKFGHGSGGAISQAFGASNLEKNVTLPHDGALEFQRDSNYDTGAGNAYVKEENCHYSKTFFIPEKEKDQLFYVEFEGIYRNAYVYVNNSFVCRHPYGYGNFYADITRFLKFGQENQIYVIVRNAGQSGRWYTGAGIYRDVKLMKSNRVHLICEGIHIAAKSADDTMAVLGAQIEIENRNLETKKVRVEIFLKDAENHTVAQNNVPITICEGTREKINIPLFVREPQLWDENHPYLYQYVVKITEGGEVLDTEQGTYGIRIMTLDVVNGLRINGKTVKLKGCCIHHDNGVIGATESRHASELRIQKLKAAGYNAIRSAHNPMSRTLLDACDKYGLYVMDEFTDVWTTTKLDFDYGNEFSEWWEYDLKQMVYKDYNHPSVIMYSIGNEIPETGNSLDCAWGKKLTDKIRELDCTRYTINCINLMMAVIDRLPEVVSEVSDDVSEINSLMTFLGTSMSKITGSEYVARATEESCGTVDIVGYNYAAVRYGIDQERFPQRIMLGSETNPRDLAENWALVEKYPNVLGDFSWTGWDYIGEAGIGRTLHGEEIPGISGSYPWRTAYCGDFDILGNRRPVSYWRESIWRMENVTSIAVQPPVYYRQNVNMTQWGFSDAVKSWNFSGYEGAPVKAEVYSNAEEVELLINGVSVGRKKVGETRKNAAYFDIIYEKGTIEAVSFTDGKEVGRDKMETASEDVTLKAQADEKNLPADGSDLAFIDIELLDKNGILNPEREVSISVSLDGPGKLIGFGTANPQTEEWFGEKMAVTYEGRARAAIRATGEGWIYVTFSSEIGDSVVKIEAI